MPRIAQVLIDRAAAQFRRDPAGRAAGREASGDRGVRGGVHLCLDPAERADDVARTGRRLFEELAAHPEGPDLVEGQLHDDIVRVRGRQRTSGNQPA